MNRALQLIVVGTSLGGMQALQQLFAAFPAGFPIPIAVVQHRHKTSDKTLVRVLQGSCALRLIEAEDKRPILAGAIYVAPADYHLLVERGYFSLSTEGPVQYSRPSIDLLFESAADAYPGAVAGVLLTGNNEDGAAGLRRIKHQGGIAIVQDPGTAEAPIMPAAGILAGEVDVILPLEQIGPYLVQTVEG